MPATPPTESDLKNFLAECKAALPGTDFSEAGGEQGAASPRNRCIGWNLETSETICGLVIAGDKTGTFSLPWLHATHPDTKPGIGDFVVLSNFEGEPRALLQTVALTLLTFGEIDASHTALDGPAVRDLDVWREVHTKYWNGLLEPLGKEVGDKMPVVAERFVCVFPQG